VISILRSRHGSFINYLLWYLGWMFLLSGIGLIASLAMLRAGYKFIAPIAPTFLLLAGYNIELAIRDPFNAVSILIAVIVAVRCRVGLWLAVPAWIIGFLGISLLSYMHRLNREIFVWYAPPALSRAFNGFQFYEYLVIGAALLLNRWLVRRRRLKVEAATPAVFD